MKSHLDQLFSSFTTIKMHKIKHTHTYTHTHTHTHTNLHYLKKNNIPSQ